jgi:hypothetical protein
MCGVTGAGQLGVLLSTCDMEAIERKRLGGLLFLSELRLFPLILPLCLVVLCLPSLSLRSHLLHRIASHLPRCSCITARPHFQQRHRSRLTSAAIASQLSPLLHLNTAARQQHRLVVSALVLLLSLSLPLPLFLSSPS